MAATDNNVGLIDPTTGLRTTLINQQLANADPTAATTQTPAAPTAPAQFTTQPVAAPQAVTDPTQTSTLVARNDPAGQTVGPQGASTGLGSTAGGPSGDAQTWLLSQLNSGADPQGAIDRLNGAGGAYAGLAADYYPSKGAGVIGLAGGSYLAKNADGSWSWNVGDSGGGGTTPAPTAQPTNTPAGAPAPGPSDSSAFDQFLSEYQAQQAAEAAQKAQVNAFLMQQLQANSGPVDPNSPEIAAPVSAAQDAAARSTAAERTAFAENAYATGNLNSDAIPQQIQQSAETNATNLGTLRATLIQNEYNQKRQTMTQLLSEALQNGNADAAQQIQVQIAALDAAVQREGLGIGLAENTATLNQNAALAGLTGS